MTRIATAAGFPDGDPYKDRPIGRVLTKMGKLTRQQVHHALTVQADAKLNGVRPPLGEVLIQLGMCTREEIELTLQLQRGKGPPPARSAENA